MSGDLEEGEGSVALARFKRKTHGAWLDKRAAGTSRCARFPEPKPHWPTTFDLVGCSPQPAISLLSGQRLVQFLHLTSLALAAASEISHVCRVCLSPPHGARAWPRDRGAAGVFPESLPGLWHASRGRDQDDHPAVASAFQTESIGDEGL